MTPFWSTLPSRFRTLLGADRNLLLLIASGAFGGLSTGLIAPTLALFVYGKGLSLEYIGLVFSAAALLPVALQPIFGAISDRFGRRAVLVPLSCLGVLMLPAVALFSSPRLLALALCARAALEQITVPLFTAAAADQAPEQKRASLFSWIGSASGIAFVAALFASPLINRGLNTSHLLLFAAALQLVDTLLLLGIRERRIEIAQAKPPALSIGEMLRQGLLAPLLALRDNRSLAALGGFLFLRAFGLAVFPIYVPLLLVQLGAAPASVGPILALSWLVFAVVQPLGGRLADRLPQRKSLISLGLLGMVMGTLVFASAAWVPLSARLSLALIAWIFLALPDGLSRPAISALPLDLAPTAKRGAFIGALSSLTTLSSVIAPFLYGIIAQRVSLPAAFCLSSGALLAAFCALLRVAP